MHPQEFANLMVKLMVKNLQREDDRKTALAAPSAPPLPRRACQKRPDAPDEFRHRGFPLQMTLFPHASQKVLTVHQTPLPHTPTRRLPSRVRPWIHWRRGGGWQRGVRDSGGLPEHRVHPRGVRQRARPRPGWDDTPPALKPPWRVWWGAAVGQP